MTDVITLGEIQNCNSGHNTVRLSRQILMETNSNGCAVILPDSYDCQNTQIDALPQNQSAILLFLIHKIPSRTSYREINNYTGISICSVRDVLTRLINKGYLVSRVTIRNRNFQGFEYQLNKAQCNQYMCRQTDRPFENPIHKKTTEPTKVRDDSQTVTQTITQDIASLLQQKAEQLALERVAREEFDKIWADIGGIEHHRLLSKLSSFVLLFGSEELILTQMQELFLYENGLRSL